MKSQHHRRLTFEILESKASPSALLLALAPLEEPEQGVIEVERAMYAPTNTAAAASVSVNAGLLQFIEQHTRDNAENRVALPTPTPEDSAVADKMMQATDTDLRTMLIPGTWEGTSTFGDAADDGFV